jgi:serine/threonine protein kinase
MQEISGTTIAGRYRILDTLGQGGRGTVYMALDLRVSRVVALKLLRFVSNSESARLIREFTVLASLSHPNIVKAYDCGKADDLDYIALEYVEGRSLARILVEEKPLDLDAALGVVCQVGRALEYAHENGVVHRDVKPANILISNHGRVLLSDFGLARPFRESGLTEIGTIVGTPRYMSPEQATGRCLDPRSDVFSLGVVLYQSLTGRYPFSGESTGAVLKNLVESDPPQPSTFNAVIDPSLQNVVLKALAKDPERRFLSMHLFMEALGSMGFRAVGSKEVLNLARMGNDSSDEQDPTETIDDEDVPDSSAVVTYSKKSSAGAEADDVEGGNESVLPAQAEGRRMLTTRASMRDSFSALFGLRDAGNVNNAAEPANQFLEASPTTETTPHITLPLSSFQIHPTEPTALAWLLVLNGVLRGRQFRLRDTFTIGRFHRQDLSLEMDPSVSRHHAVIRLEDGRFFICDVGAKFGTKVNGVSVERKELQDRDEIRIGSHALLFISAVSPADLTLEAKRRLQSFDSLWEGLVQSVRHD